MAPPTTEILSLSWSPDSRLLAAAEEGRAVRIWDTDTGTLRLTLDDHPAQVHSLSWSPAADCLATACDDGLVRLWSPTTGALLATLRHHRGAVRVVAWSPDGSTLLSGGDDGRLVLWDADGRLRGWMAATEHGSVCVAPDGSHRVTGDVSSWFWIAHGLHRYEVGELDRWLPAIRIRDDEPFPWGRTTLPGLTPPAP